MTVKPTIETDRAVNWLVIFTEWNTNVLAAQRYIQEMMAGTNTDKIPVTALTDIGGMNMLVNGDFRHWNRGTNFTPGIGAQITADGWFLTSNLSSVTNVSQTIGSAPPNHVSAAQINYTHVSGGFSKFVQILDSQYREGGSAGGMRLIFSAKVYAQSCPVSLFIGDAGLNILAQSVTIPINTANYVVVSVSCVLPPGSVWSAGLLFNTASGQAFIADAMLMTVPDDGLGVLTPPIVPLGSLPAIAGISDFYQKTAGEEKYSRLLRYQTTMQANLFGFYYRAGESIFSLMQWPVPLAFTPTVTVTFFAGNAMTVFSVSLTDVVLVVTIPPAQAGFTNQYVGAQSNITADVGI